MEAHRSTKRLCFAVKVCLIATYLTLAPSLPTRADAGSQIVGDFIDALIEAGKADRRKKAYEAWKRLEGPIIGCLRQKYRIEPNNLIQRGIGPEDKRVRPYIASCQEELRQAQARAAEEERQRRLAAAAQAERERLAQEAAEREIKRREEAEAARIAAEREARIRDLNSRFPHSWVPKIIAGEIELGWTREAVREALGPPRSVVRTPDGSEMWTYDSLKVVFTNGKVTYFGA